MAKITACGKFRPKHKPSKTREKSKYASYDDFLVAECLTMKIEPAFHFIYGLKPKEGEEVWRYDDHVDPLHRSFGIVIIKNGKIINKVSVGDF